MAALHMHTHPRRRAPDGCDMVRARATSTAMTAISSWIGMAALTDYTT
jgi:hypothetical protein